jgi:rsbT antagonist protein RsbS
MDEGNIQRIPLQISYDCVVASIQIDLTEAVLHHFQADLLERLQTSGATGVILDLSGVMVIDLEDFKALRMTMEMASVMGTVVVFSGFRPGVVSSLVELNADIDGIQAALNLDDAFQLVEKLRSGS